MLWIKNGRVIDPATSTDAALDVLIDGENIVALRHARRYFATRREARRIRLAKQLTPPAGSSRPASSICIATCANPAAKLPKQLLPALAPPRAEDSPQFVPCRIRGQ